MFASCPHEFSGCSEKELIHIPVNGGSVNLNATVAHLPGGRCGYKQKIKLIKLMSINQTTNESEHLLTCFVDEIPYRQTRLRPFNGNASLNNGSSGFEFQLTLFNISAKDSGLYAVMVELDDVGNGGIQYLTKTFSLGK